MVHNSLITGLGFTLKDLESVPFGVALPIREAIYRCREQPCSDWLEEVCLLIGRQDLTKQAHKMTLAKSKAVSGTTTVSCQPPQKLTQSLCGRALMKVFTLNLVPQGICSHNICEHKHYKICQIACRFSTLFLFFLH